MRLEHEHARQAAHPVDIGKPGWSGTSHQWCQKNRHRGSIQNQADRTAKLGVIRMEDIW